MSAASTALDTATPPEARRMEKRAEAEAEAYRDRTHLIVAAILTAPCSPK
jgi:hypothetical protein